MENSYVNDSLLAYSQILEQASPSRGWWQRMRRRELHPARPEVRGKEYRNRYTQEGEPYRNRVFTTVLMRRYLEHRREWYIRGETYPDTYRGTSHAVGYRAWLGLTTRKERRSRG